MNIRPLHDRILVRRLDAEQKTEGGILLPDSAQEKPQEGQVVATGEGKLLESGNRQPLGVKKGDKVLFGKYSGTEVKLGGEELVVMREDDIMAVIEE